MKLKLRQYFCKHDMELIATMEGHQQNLWKCSKYNVYYIAHYGLGIGYFSKTQHLKNWKYI